MWTICTLSWDRSVEQKLSPLKQQHHVSITHTLGSPFTWYCESLPTSDAELSLWGWFIILKTYSPDSSVLCHMTRCLILCFLILKMLLHFQFQYLLDGHTDTSWVPVHCSTSQIPSRAEIRLGINTEIQELHLGFPCWWQDLNHLSHSYEVKDSGNRLSYTNVDVGFLNRHRHHYTKMPISKYYFWLIRTNWEQSWTPMWKSML